jgi:hypothetical protein
LGSIVCHAFIVRRCLFVRCIFVRCIFGSRLIVGSFLRRSFWLRSIFGCRERQRVHCMSGG